MKGDDVSNVPTFLLVGLTATLLLLLLGWQIAIKLSLAIRHRFLSVVRLELLLAALLVICSVGLLRAWARNAGGPFSRSSVIVLLIACTISASIGNGPGVFLSSPWASASVVLLLCGVAALGLSALNGKHAGEIAFWAVGFAAVSLAVWQVSAPPLLARFLIHH